MPEQHEAVHDVFGKRVFFICRKSDAKTEHPHQHTFITAYETRSINVCAEYSKLQFRAQFMAHWSDAGGRGEMVSPSLS